MGKKAAKRDPSVVVGYVRVSMDRQKLGPVVQRKILAGWCVLRGLHLAAVFTDKGVSGGLQVDQRPGLQEALVAVRAYNAGTLLVASRDRLSRDIVTATMIERGLNRSGTSIVSADGLGNGDSPAEVFIRTVVNGMAQYGRAVISERTRAALRLKVSRGEKTGGAAPYGYQLARDEIHLVQMKEEMKVIARIQKLHKEGLSIRRIADLLTEEETPSRGHRWHRTTVERLLNRDDRKRDGA